jgi:choline monooxygenase
LTEATGFPAWTYHDPEFFRLERQRYFNRSWLFVAHDSDLPSDEPGWYSMSVSGVPVLLTRDRDGVTRAFHNVCTHRGAPLGRIGDPAACSGRSRNVVCPYHAWAFGLDGELRGAPGMDAHPGWNKAAHALRPLRLDRWGPFWFVNPSGDATPLTEQLGPAVERFAGAQLDKWVRVHRHDYFTDSNWKFYVENNAEYYHEPTAHGTSYLAKEVSWNNNFHAIKPEVSDYCYLQESPFPANAPELTGQMRPNTVMPGLSPMWQGASSIFQFWPNFAWILNPNLFVLYLIDPISPTRTRIRWDWMVPDTAEARAPENLEPLKALYDQVQREDLAIFEAQQKAVDSSAFTMGQLNPRSEIGLHRFQHQLMEYLTGAR